MPSHYSILYSPGERVGIWMQILGGHSYYPIFADSILSVDTNRERKKKLSNNKNRLFIYQPFAQLHFNLIDLNIVRTTWLWKQHPFGAQIHNCCIMENVCSAIPSLYLSGGQLANIEKGFFFSNACIFNCCCWTVPYLYWFMIIKFYIKCISIFPVNAIHRNELLVCFLLNMIQ